MKNFLNFTARCCVVFFLLFLLGIGLIDRYQDELKELYVKVSGPSLNSEARKKIESESRIISDDFGSYGSGCEQVDGFVFTARHLVEDTILDQNIGLHPTLHWNDKPARVYSYSSTFEDYAIITTTPEGTKFPTDGMKFSSIPPREGQILHTYSSPGDMPNLYQKLEVVKVWTDAKTKSLVISFKADYVQGGISGGCVVDEHGDFVGIIKNKKLYDDPKAMQFGEITQIKSVD